MYKRQIYYGTIAYCFISAFLVAIFNFQRWSFVLAHAPGNFNYMLLPFIQMYSALCKALYSPQHYAAAGAAADDRRESTRGDGQAGSRYVDMGSDVRQELGQAVASHATSAF